MDMSQYWDGWEPIVHTLVTLVTGYLALTILLRIFGARTMASMTQLDLIIAVTGSSVLPYTGQPEGAGGVSRG